ncbi:MAG TPA: crosslink repair DNA glycosylase YcaQ family protein [Vicinamibacterales bacterium]|nr:crosslink repair DNA glycosylase YcaQ family protein [Vicinamibacterales bacterium]
MADPTLDDLRRYAVARSLFPPTTLARAIERLGFVQADPIRAPARAQDLTLRHRVKNYKAGDLERRYPRLAVEEGFFVNYGFLRRADYLRFQSRGAPRSWTPATRRRVAAILDFIRERGAAHPRDVEARFSHGKTTNYWGGSSNATTHLLDTMHYRGLLRVARRERGIRVYAAQRDIPQRTLRGSDAGAANAADAARELAVLIDLVVRKYAPLPGASLNALVRRLRYAAPHWQQHISPALDAAKKRIARARVDGVDWFWPADERPASRRYAVVDRVCLLSPFDPVVWDRRRFELLWGWPYRFEAYTPAPKRVRGYYALPLLWRDRVIGWGNVTWKDNRLSARLGFAAARPDDPAFEPLLELELASLARFLGADASAHTLSIETLHDARS